MPASRLIVSAIGSWLAGFAYMIAGTPKPWVGIPKRWRHVALRGAKVALPSTVLPCLYSTIDADNDRLRTFDDKVAMRSSGHRVLLLIKTLNDLGPLSVLELESATGMSRPAIYRLLDLLSKMGYVRRLRGQASFQLTIAANELNSRVGYRERLIDIATPLLNELQWQIVWPASLSTLYNGKMLTAVTTKGRSPFVFDRGRVGKRLPILETAQGLAYLAFCEANERRAILSFLKHSLDPEDALIKTPQMVKKMLAAVSAKSFAVRTGKLPANTSSVAVPVLVERTAVAAISVSFLTTAFKIDEALNLFLKPLQETAAAIAAKFPREV